MPSDPRVTSALAALRPRLEAFRSAVRSTLQRAENLLAPHGSASSVMSELGVFAASRIDFARFAAIDAGHPSLDTASRLAVTRAVAALTGFANAADDAFVLDVPPGGSLVDFVAAAHGQLGRAFGAAALVELARTGRYRSAEHDHFLEAYGFEHWGRSERFVAPPLVVLVDGRDMRPAGLADMLDGDLALIIVVRGACSPAPLTRLITPGTLVIQAAEPTALDRFATWTGPAVGALVPATAAQFTHDPTGGSQAWQRLRITSMPELPRRPLGRWSVAQQREELSQLEVLALKPGLGDTAIEALAPGRDGDPVDRLASWLLTASGQPS